MLSIEIGFIMESSTIRFIIGIFIGLLKEAGKGEWLVMRVQRKSECLTEYLRAKTKITRKPWLKT